jgi:hypothetical protein
MSDPSRRQRKLWNEFWGPWQSVVAVVGLVLVGWYSEKLVGSVWGHVLEGALFLLLIHAMEKVFFWKELSDTVEDRMEKVAKRHDDLLGKVLSCGIEYVYINRKEAATEVADAMKNAKKRIWLLGIAFSKKVTVNSLLTPQSSALVKYMEGKNRDFDLKILLMDPLRSPAVFRGFLESQPATVKEMIDFDRPGDVGRDPLFQPHTLYREIEQTLASVREHQILRDAIRFYAHDAACWLVIADNVAFYEPYTFGSPRSERSGRCIGEFLPVFRLRGPVGKGYDATESAEAFHIIEDHFAKLWITSDVDFFHFDLRDSDKAKIAAEVFSRRKEWFERVHASLEHWERHKLEWYKTRKWPERRKHPRLPCEAQQQGSPELTWKSKAGEKTFTANVLDFSQNGISLSIAGSQLRTLTQFVDEFRQIQGKDKLNEALCDEEVALSFPSGTRQGIVRHFTQGKLRLRWFEPAPNAASARVGIENAG